MKTMTRTFELNTEISLAQQWADEVIDAIENDDLNVLDPNDYDALDECDGADGSLLMNAHLSKTVSIKE